MPKLKMQKIELIALLPDRKKIMERLQRRGVVEVTEVEDPELARLNTASSVSQFDKHCNTAIQALEILDQYAPEKVGLLSSLNGRTPVEKHEFGRRVTESDSNLSICYKILALHKQIGEDKATIVRNETLMDSLRIWLPLDIPMQYRGSKYTVCYVGILPNNWTESDLLAALARAIPQVDALEVQVIAAYKEQTCVTVHCMRGEEESVLNALRDLGFVFPSDPTKHPPQVRMDRYQKEIDACRQRITENTEKIKAFAPERSKIQFEIDYLTVRKEKYQQLAKVGLTQNTFVLTGYIAAKDVPKLRQELEERFDLTLTITDPDPEEDVPVLLENNRFVAPVEGITEMYALPGKRDVDPNPVMSFFYYLFFGMMLSDAGYGLLMVLGCSFALAKFTLEKPMRRSLTMFRNCGISTLFWGALFGSWFGNAPQQIAKTFFGKSGEGSTALWFEPINDPVRLLLFCFLLGIIHLFVGVGVNLWNTWRQGHRLDAILDNVPVFLTVAGAAPLAGNVLSPMPAWSMAIGKWLALVGVVLIVLTGSRSSKNIFARFFGGLYALYNTATGYLGDILSYSRLLALGLATGQIAYVINLVCGMVDGKNTVFGGILFTLIFIVGHIANLAINLLGAYVHSDRLMFVEMFGKFYEGGGRAFRPFGVNTKYYKFKEES